MSQELLLEQKLLTREFVERGKDPTGEYVSIEELKRRGGGNFIIPRLGNLKVLSQESLSTLPPESGFRKSVAHHLGCTMILDKTYSYVRDPTNNPSKFVEYPIRIKIATENQNSLEQCSEFLRGLGYVEVNQGGK